MLRKLFSVLKPKEYSLTILPGATSQAAVKRVNRNRFKTPAKHVLTTALIGVALVSGTGTLTAGATTTANQAEAMDVISQLFCVDGNSADAGKWGSGNTRFANLGGWSPEMDEIRSNTVVNGVALFGVTGSSWDEVDTTGRDGKYVTAYEKYGFEYPQFTSWFPVWADNTYTFKGASTTSTTITNGTTTETVNVYNDGDNTIPVSTLPSRTVEAGASGLTTSDPLSCRNLLATMEAPIANMIAAPAKFLILAGNALYGAAYGTSISEQTSVLYPIGNAINDLVTKPGGLRDTLFVPFIIPLILFGAIWLAYMGLVKRQTTLAWQSIIWMVAAIAAGTVFLAQPTLLSSSLDYGVATIQQAINGAVLAGGNGDDMCDIDSAGDTNAVTRETQCTIWYSAIYAPWVTGQFGVGLNSAESSDPNSNTISILVHDPRDFLDTTTIEYGSEQTVTPTNWAQLMLDRQVVTQRFDLSEVAYSQLSGDGSGVNSIWAGGSMSQVTAAVLMDFGALASTAVIIVFSFMLLAYQLVMVTAVLLSPLFFLAGIVPGWGRRVLARYAELLVGVTVKRIITSLVLAVYLVFYKLIVGEGILIIQILLVGVLAFFTLTYRSRFVNMLTDNINFGGDKSIGLPGRKAGEVTAGVGGAVAGGLIGGVVGAAVLGTTAKRKAQKFNDENTNIYQESNVPLMGNATADVTPVRNKVGETAQLGQAVMKGAKDGKELSEFAKDAGSKIGGKGAEKSTAVPSAGPKKPIKPVTPGSTPPFPTAAAEAAATVAPSAPVSAAGATGGAVAAGGAGTAAAAAGGAGGAAAGAATAAGGAAATTAGAGAAAGAAAGSVVPVAGTIAGAVAGAAIVTVASQQKQKKENDKRG